MADTSFGTQMTDPLRPVLGSPTVEPRPRAAGGEHDDDREPLRGTVALPHPRAVLLTDDVAVDVERLPRWQPQIFVDEGRRIDDDDE